MTLAQALSTYLTLNLLLLIGSGGLGLLAVICNARLGAGVQLRLHYAVIVLLLAFTCLHPLFPSNDVFSPAAKVWSAPSIQTFADNYAPAKNRGYLSLPTPIGTSTLSSDHVALASLALFSLLLLAGGIAMSLDLYKLYKLQRQAFLIKKIGRVRVLVSDSVGAPFSFWLPRQACIVLPAGLLQRQTDFKMAVAHELQHHRSGDTRWVYVLWMLRLICLINPAIHLWNRWLSELQEFACDETLVDRKKVATLAYARCLVEVAQSAVGLRRPPVCATGLTFLTQRNLLKRRIERMLSTSGSSPKYKRPLAVRLNIAAAVILASVMGVTAFAAKGLIQDRRVSLDQATAMAARAQSKSGFPVVVNDLVLAQLNMFIGTPEGREFMRLSLQRMENYRGVVSETLQRYEMPAELMALPIIETGYRNLTEEQSNTQGRAAGLWQFVRQTARGFGLIVDGRKDERVDVELSTDAAMRVLLANKLRFNDWHLSVLAYNAGASRVQDGIEATGSRDTWTLIRSGHEGDKDYLPRLMAAILIMRNPEYVQ